MFLPIFQEHPFPVCIEGEQSAMADRSETPKTARILIVEDELMVAKDFARSLTNLGYEVTGKVSSAEKAIAMVENDKPDLVLMDIDQPGVTDGTEAAHRIWDQFGVPVVYLTRFEGIGLLERIKKTMPYGCLRKRATLGEIANTVETALFRRQADKRAIESEERLAFALESADLGWWDWNVQTGELLVNERWAQIGGYSLSEILPHIDWWRDRIHEDDRPAMLKALSDHLDCVTPAYEMEHRFQTKDGQWKWILVKGKVIERDEDGKALRMVGTRLDVTDRKKAEEARRTSEKQLANALEMARLGHWELDVLKKEFTFNDQFYKLFRTTAEQVGGYKMALEEYARRFVHPDEISVISDENRKAIETDDPYFSRELEHRIAYADGEIGHISVRFFVVKDEQGRTVKTYGVNQDITDRKKAEEALRESERRYRALVENMRSAVAVFRAERDGEDFVFVDFNKAGETIENVRRQEIVGKSVQEVFPGVREFGLFDVFQRVWRTGKAEKHPVALYKDERIQGWRENFVYRLPSGEVVSVYADETEHKKAEEALRESENRYRKLFEESRDAIALATEDGDFLDVNQAFLDLFGYTRKECMNLNAQRLWADPASRSKWTQEVASGGGKKDYEWTALKKDGTLIHCLVTTTPKRLPNGLVLFQSIIRDVTEQKRYQEGLKKARDELERRVRARTIELTTTNEQLVEEMRERKAAEKALREEKAFTERALDTLTDAFVVFDLNGRLLRWNGAVSRISGYSNEEIAGMNPTDFFSGEAVQVAAEAIELAIKEGHSALETSITTKEGMGIPFEFTGDLLKDHEGRPVSICCLGRDIRERKQAEKAFQESEARYREVVDKANSIILRMDPHGNVNFINDFAQRFFGFSEKEILGRNVVGTIVPKRESSGRDLMAMIRDIGCVPHLYKYNENENMRRNGERVWIAWTNRGITDDSGRIVEVLCIGNDITDSKRDRDRLQEEHYQLEKQVELRIADLKMTDARLRREIAERKVVERALKGSEERYRSLFHGSKDGVYITTKEGRLIETNQSLRDMFGYTEEEMVGSRAEDYYIDSANHRDLIAEMGSSGSVQDYSVRLRKKDGTEMQCLLTGGVRYYDGDVIEYQGVLRDVTEYKRLEEQLFQAQKMQAIGTLAAGIAHDFNNILFAIIGYTELCLDEIPRDAPLRVYLETVVESGRRAKNLVNRILTFSRQSQQQRRLLNVAPIAEEAIKFLRASLPSTIEIKQRIEPELQPVLADPTEIHQVLMNLCTNAGHAMRETGGLLELIVENFEVDESGKAIHREVLPGSYLRISVTDTGKGMEEETLQRIFEPYYTTKKKGEGTGLGLAVVHGIIASCGGAITVSSQLRHGTTFQVYLPTQEAKPVQESEPGDKPVPKGSERILLVDDEPNIASMAQQMLERLGYEVVSLTNSREALELFRSRANEFDLIITDMTMPDLTGLELAQEIRNIPSNIPLILCTGFSELISKDKTQSLGISEVVMKPVLRKDMAKAVRRALDDECMSSDQTGVSRQ